MCPLLSLPGELRNRVYNYCSEPGPIALPSAVHRAPLRPRFGGLRHVCKTLYIEFTPIYLDRTIVSLHPSDVERYLSAVYPKSQILQEEDISLRRLPPNVHGDIRINLRLSEVLDLTPFAALLLRAPKMRVEFARAPTFDPMLGSGLELLRTITNTSCSVDFQRIVERMLFRYSLRAEVVIRLHRDVTFEELFGGMVHRSPQQWLLQQGFPVLGNLRIVMESSKGILRDVPDAVAWSESLRSSLQHPTEPPLGSSQTQCSKT